MLPNVHCIPISTALYVLLDQVTALWYFTMNHLLVVLPVLGVGAWWLILFSCTPLKIFKHVLQVVEVSKKTASNDIIERASNKRQN